MSLKNKNMKLDDDIKELSAIAKNYQFGSEINKIQKAYDKIIEDYNNFIVSSTLDKINTAFKTDATGKQGKYNEQDEKHNQQLINDVKAQVKNINQSYKKIGYIGTINATIKSDSLFERFKEIGTGDGYYIKRQIGDIINNINFDLEFLNGEIKDLKTYGQVLNATITKNIKNAKEEVDVASQKTNGAKIVIDGKNKLESYKNRLADTSSLLQQLKKECKQFSTKLEELKSLSIKNVGSSNSGSSSNSSSSSKNINSRTWEDFASH